MEKSLGIPQCGIPHALNKLQDKPILSKQKGEKFISPDFLNSD